MPVPTAVQKRSDISAAVDEVVGILAPDVVRIRYNIGEDWSGQWAIFFRIVISDSAAKSRLRRVAGKVIEHLAERLDFDEMGVFPYHNFRSASEQAALREHAWA